MLSARGTPKKTEIRFSADSIFFAVGTSVGKVFVFSAEDGKLVKEFSEHTKIVTRFTGLFFFAHTRRIRWNPHPGLSDTFASCSADSKVVLYKDITRYNNDNQEMVRSRQF